MSNKIKILIVDDSRIFRAAIEDALSGERDMKVIGSVRNGIKAIEFIKSTPPDMVTLDVEMPDMDGLETLHGINKFNASHTDLPNIGVIMLSSFTHNGADITIKALETGAFDFITKPFGRNIEENSAALSNLLTVKIRTFISKRIFLNKQSPSQIINRATVPEKDIDPTNLTRVKAIVIGVSTGGPKALAAMLPDLSQKVDIPIFIVQHMPPTFTQSLAASLDSKCSHKVKEGSNDEIIQLNHIYIAPGGKHMLLREDLSKQQIITINEQPSVSGCRPSVDVLFRSAVTVYGGEIIGIILTGMGNDGTKGAASLKRAGAYTVVQDEQTSVVWGMPGSAVASGYVDNILPLNIIPDAVEKIIRKRK